MKRALFITIFLFSLFSESVFAQTENELDKLSIEEVLRPKMPTKIDTLYYPFYNGVQMIEIDHIGYWDRKIFYLEQSFPRAIPHSMFHPMPIGNEYLFRNKKGIIVKAFNTEKSLDELTIHFKNISINEKHPLSAFFPYHNSQAYRYDGVWPYSPNSLFNFQGHYKVSNGIQGGLDPKNIKFGLIDSSGNIKVPIEYDEIIPWYGNLLVQKNKKWGIINYEQKAIVNPEYNSYRVDTYSGSVYPDKKRNLFFVSLKMSDGHKNYYSYDAVFFSSKNELFPLNNYDEIHFEGSWSPNEDYSKRILFVTKNGKRGLLNAQYEEIVSPEFEIFEYHKNIQGLYRVAKNGKFGFWDKNFKQIIPLEYDYVESFRKDSIALVLKNGKFFCINTQGKKQTQCNLPPNWKMEQLGFFIDKNYVKVFANNDIFGVIDNTTREIILPIKYRSPIPIELKSFYNRNESTFKQNNFEINIPNELYYEMLFYNNKIIVKNNKNHYGVIDTNFRVLVDFKYDTLEVVYDLKHLIYSRNGKLGLIDFSGRDILTTEYDEVRYSKHYEQERDIFQVKKDGKWGIVNFKNKTLVPCVYDSIKFLGHWNRPRVKLWVVEKNNKFGVVDDKNQIFIPFDYDGISHLAGTTLWVEDKDGNRYSIELRK